MGNSSCAGKRFNEARNYGDVFVQLNQTSFVAGDTVNGTIYLDLKAPYPGDKLCFKFKGTEYATFIDKEARTRQRPDGTAETYYVDIKRESERFIIQQTIDVYDWKYGTVLPPGQFTFPITFKIPDNAPGSFFLHQGTTVAEIRYRIEGFLKPEHEKNPKIKHKLDIPIREKAPTQIQTTDVNLTKGLKTWCCIDQGAINVNTSFEKNAYAPSEEARIMCDIDNSKCGLAVQDIVFELTQSVSLRASNHSRGLGYTIRSLNLGTIAPGQTCLGNQRKCASFVLPPGQMGFAKALKKEDHNIQAPHPSQVLTPSTHGALIKSDFYLSVRCVMEGCICCDDSSAATSLPIQIYAPLMPQMPAPTPPPQWNPQPMPTANITIVIVPSTSPQIQPNTMPQPNQTPGQPQMMTNGQMPPYQGPPPQQQQQGYPSQYPPQQQQQQGYPPQYPPQQQQQGYPSQYPPQYPPQQQQGYPPQYPPQQQQGYPPQQQPNYGY